MKARLTESTWQEALAAMKPERGRPGPEWFSLAEAARSFGLSESGTKPRLRALESEGKLEKTERLDGRVWRAFYRIIPPKKD